MKRIKLNQIKIKSHLLVSVACIVRLHAIFDQYIASSRVVNGRCDREVL